MAMMIVLIESIRALLYEKDIQVVRSLVLGIRVVGRDHTLALLR